MESGDIKRFGLILSVQAEIEAMKIENLQRDLQSEAPAFTAEDFQDKAHELSNLCYCDEMQL